MAGLQAVWWRVQVGLGEVVWRSVAVAGAETTKAERQENEEELQRV